MTWHVFTITESYRIVSLSLKVSTLHAFTPPLPPASGNYWSFYNLHSLPFTEYHIVKIILHVAILEWFLLLVICISFSSTSFYDLIAHFFWCWKIFHCLHVPLKNILIAFSFWQTWIKLLYTCLCKFLCGHVFNPFE